jgi:hypothetical protein
MSDNEVTPLKAENNLENYILLNKLKSDLENQIKYLKNNISCSDLEFNNENLSHIDENMNNKFDSKSQNFLNYSLIKNNIFEKTYNKIKQKNKFPFLIDMKKFTNLPEKERIEKLAYNVNNYLYTNLTSAVIDSKQRNNFNESSIIFSFHLPRGLRRKIQSQIKRQYLSRKSKSIHPDEEIICEINIEKNELNESNELDETILNIFGIQIKNLKQKVDSDKSLRLSDYINQKEKELKDILHFEKYDTKERKYCLINKSVELFLTNLSETLKEVPLKKYDKIFYERFIIFFANFISYLSGLKCHFSIDAFKFLTLEFYGDNEIYEHLAEKYHYFLNLKILSNFKIYNFLKGKEKSFTRFNNITTKKFEKETNTWVDITDLNEKNNTQFEKTNSDDVSFFTPYLNFTVKNKDLFRRFTKNDKFHDCEYKIKQNKITKVREKIKKTKNEKLLKSVKFKNEEKKSLLLSNIKDSTTTINKKLYKCQLHNECSIFRNIDKLRLINHPLQHLINLKELKKLNFFRSILVMRNEDAYKSVFSKSKIFLGYLLPYESISVKRLNNNLRNYYGETVGYYFVFISHYIKWLLLPSVFGIIWYIIPLIIDLEYTNKDGNLTVKDFLGIFYIFIIIIWAITYINSWVSNQKFYNYIWGQDKNNLEQKENENCRAENAIVYFNVYIPISNYVKKFYRRLISIFISLIMVLITVLVNIFLFYISNQKVFKKFNSVENMKNLNKTIPLFSNTTNFSKSENFSKQNPKLSFNITDFHSNKLSNYSFFYDFNLHKLTTIETNEIRSTFWYHLIPVLSVIIRNLLSMINYKIAEKLTDYENNMLMSQYEDRFMVKIIIFEFVNYYFGLFYIAYFKRGYEICAGNNCFDELGHQLVTIIITSNILNIFEIGIPLLQNIYRKNFLKKLINDKFSHIEDSKLHLYYKTEYYDTMIYEYVEVILSYGYIILFGISSPICFLFTLMSAWVERMTDCYKLVKFHNISIIEGSKGIGITLKILKVFTFLGIITNTSIAFFEIDAVKDSVYRWYMLFVVENFIIFLFFIINYSSLPSWFTYLDQIKFNYFFKSNKIFSCIWGLGIGDWGLGIGPIPNPPIPNPHSKFRKIVELSVKYFFI